MIESQDKKCLQTKQTRPELDKIVSTSMRILLTPTAVTSIRIETQAHKNTDNGISVTGLILGDDFIAVCDIARNGCHTHGYFLQNLEIRQRQQARSLNNSCN